MSDYPNQLDDDVTLPRIDDNITQLGGDAINALRSAVFNIEEALGPAAPGGLLQTISLVQFLLQDQPLDAAGNPLVNTPFFLPNGYVNPSFFVSIPQLNNIVDSQISPAAGIRESKLALDYPTAALFSFIQQVNLGTQQSLNFITNHGSKIEPHIQGTNFNHYMEAILVAPSTLNYFTNDQGLFRDNSNLYNLFNDLNTDYIKHQVANSTPVTITSGQQSGGTVPPTNYAHVSAGIYLNTSNFSFVPQTATDLQSFAEFVDSSNILLLGSRIQTLYQNGIPRTGVSSSLINQTQGQLVVPYTPAVSYLLYSGTNGAGQLPVDDIDHGDDVVQFFPTSNDGYAFDALFAGVRAGDILTVNYGSFIVSHIVSEIKYIPSLSWSVRINGKNLLSQNVTATITRSLFNNEKAGVLALAQANHNIGGALPSLTVGCPSGAEVLSVNFSAQLIDNNHYNLYLAVYPNGNPLNGIFNIPVIDISGNKGATPGSYTLDNVVQTINNQFRAPGYNNRFIAFEYQGELGIKMADSINNISFSVLDGVIDPSTGLYNQSTSSSLYPANVIGVPGFDPVDASGLGPSGAGVSGPAFATAFSTSFAAQIPTKIIAPLTRKTFYVNGAEGERFALEPLMSIDGYGNGYWPATILSKTVLSNRVTTTYRVLLNLMTSGLQIGKTMTVAPAVGSSATFVDSGRYFISTVHFNNCVGCDTTSTISSTDITVYDAIQSPSGITPYASSSVGTAVNLYFSSDSVGFNSENISDASLVSTFKRLMEIYIDDSGHTFSHERARMYTGMSTVYIGNPLAPVPLYSDPSQATILANIIDVSPNFRGFQYGTINKINLQITSYATATGVFDGYLCNFAAGPTISNMGPITTGKKGTVTRFYDQTNVDYIDILFDLADTIPGISNGYVDIQLFPTLRLDQDVMLLGTAQVNTQNSTLKYLTDHRQFGNVSEQQLSNSAIDFIQAGAKYLEQNGVIRGFDIVSVNNNVVELNGGLVLVNGAFVPMNNSVVTIPIVQELYSSTQYNINWLLCVNDSGEFTTTVLTDQDPILGTPNASSRLVTVIDLANSNTYSVSSTTFSNLIGFRKDLTPLYLISSTVTGTGTSAITTLSTQDMRKYAVDSSSSIQPTLTDQLTQGNFRNFASALLWFKFNAAYQNTLRIRSAYTISEDPGSLTNQVNLIGDGSGASIQFTSSSVTNTNFTDLTLAFSPSSTISNCTFNNCTITANVLVNVGSNCSFNNCAINASNGSSQVPTVFSIIPTASNIKFISCNVNYVPNTSSGYSSANLINSGNGLIYCSTTSLQNFIVRDCTFTTTTSTRFSFVNIEYGAASSSAQTIYVENNKFYNTSLSDDMYAVIAIICTLTSAQPVEGLKLIDCRIENNICDKNQMIAITGTLSGVNLNSTIVPVSTQINGNTCGTIAIICAADSDRNYETYSDASASYDKNYGIIVSKNTCRYIGAIASNGVSFYSSSSNTMPFVHSSVMINNNATSWIHIFPSIAFNVAPYARNATLFATNNSLRAYNSSFIVALGESTAANIAIYSANNNTLSGYAVISGNTIAQGNYLTISNTVQTYDYIGCVSVGCNSSIIDGNIFNNLTNAFDMIAFNGTNDPTANITNNQFYQNSANIHSYINLNGSGTGIISGNFFDSPTVTGGSTALIANLSGTTYVIGPNVNYYHVLPRGIVQPMSVASVGLGTPVDSGGASVVFNAAAGALKMFHVINGATLSSITIRYNNATTLSSPPLFFFASINVVGGETSITGNVSGVITAGNQSLTITSSNSTLPVNFTIDDSSLIYVLGVDNANSVNVTVYPITLNFS